MRAALLAATLLSLTLTSAAYAQNDRERAVRQDKRSLQSDPLWVYDDLPEAISAAAASKKPLMILIRCLP